MTENNDSTQHVASFADTLKAALPTTTQWHERGIFGVVSPFGEPLFETFADNAHGARATLAREGNTPWSRASGSGCRMIQFAQSAALNAGADLHEKGAFVVVEADRTILFDTLSADGYGARSNYVHEHHLIWSNALRKGCQLVALIPIAEVIESRA